MYTKYVNSIPGTRDYMFYTFFTAYLNQTVASVGEAIYNFRTTSSQGSKTLLAHAISDFLKSDYPEDEKFSFIEELSSGWINRKTAKEQLQFIRNAFISY